MDGRAHIGLALLHAHRLKFIEQHMT